MCAMKPERLQLKWSAVLPKQAVNSSTVTPNPEENLCHVHVFWCTPEMGFSSVLSPLSHSDAAQVMTRKGGEPCAKH